MDGLMILLAMPTWKQRPLKGLKIPFYSWSEKSLLGKSRIYSFILPEFNSFNKQEQLQ